ncbi:MAG: MATE family efflux transporter [Eubacteriales bacterium]|nr:MATE family efflux transporter [Eubacteriales bacterium]
MKRQGQELPKQYLFTNQMLLALILPIILEQTVNLTVGLMDSIMVAAVGEAAVSGVSLIDTIYTLLLNLFSALATGGAVIAGQYLGQKNEAKAKQASTELVWTMLAASALMTLLMYLGKGFLLHVVFGQIEADVYRNAETYLMIVNLSIPFMGMYNGAAAILRTRGDSGAVLKVSALMGAINLVGNSIGVYALHAGIAGVAVPTLIARAFGGIAAVAVLLKPGKQLCLEKTWRHRFDGSMVKSILKIGVPNGLENGIFQLGKIVLLSLIASFGTGAIAANSVTLTLAGIEVIPGLAMQLAMTTVISRCVGAGDYQQARHYTRKLMGVAYLAIMALDAAIWFALPWILSIYQLTEQTAAVTTQLVLCHTLGAVMIWPLSFVLPATFRAAGDVKSPMIASILSMVIVRVGGGYWLAQVCGLGVLGTWLSMVGDWAVRSAVFCIRYHSGKWTRYRALE